MLWLAGSVFVAGDEAIVTVVVVTYQGVQLLSRCLDAVAAQKLGRPGRIACWVVDNASVDGSAELLTARTDGVRVVRSATNRGFAGGNNLALRDITSPYTVLLNDDALPEENWLEEMLRPFDDRRVAAVAAKLLLMPRFVAVPLPGGGGRVDVARVWRDSHDVTDAIIWDPLLVGPARDGARPCRPGADVLVPVAEATGALAAPVEIRIELAGRRDPEPMTLPVGTMTTDVVNSAGTVLTPDGYAADRGFGLADDGQFDSPAEVFGGCGAALALRMAAVRDVGPFDEDWFLYYEDVDLCWRLRRRGWIVHYAPDAVVRHQHSASVGTRSDLHIFYDGRNRLLTLVKNGSWGLVARTAGRYPLTTLSVAVSALRTPRRDGRGAAMHATRLRLRVLGSFARLLPRVLQKRRVLERRASVPRAQIEAWFGCDSRDTPSPIGSRGGVDRKMDRARTAAMTSVAHAQDKP